MKRTFHHVLLGGAVLVLAACDNPSDSPSEVGYPPPTSVTAVPGPHANEITVRWASKVGPGSYRVYWSTSPNVAPGSSTAIFVTPTAQDSSGVSGVHSGATSGTTYYYVVTAAVDQGTPAGPPSGVVSATASGDMGLQLFNPAPGQFAADSLKFRAWVQSRFTLQSVVASVGGQSVNLTYGSGEWRGAMPLGAMPLGPATGTIAATDVYSTVITGSFAFVHDDGAPFTLTIASPESLTVARPNIRLNVSCATYDGKGCLDVVANLLDPLTYTRLAQAPSGFDQTVSLATWDGNARPLQFVATDSTWRTTMQTRKVFVELSPNLTEVASVHGSILDVQPDRILVHTQPDSVSIGLSIHSRVSGSDVVVYNTPGHRVTAGFLTSVGAMFLERPWSGGPTVLREWQSGTVSDLGSATTLVVKGNYAAFTTGAGLIRRDLVTGTNTTVSAAAQSYDVAANGDVVWQASNDLWRFRDGVTTQLTTDGSAFADVNPKTDGINVAYWKVTNLSGWVGTAVFDAAGEHILAPSNNGYGAYRVANGWVAYNKVVAGPYQVWSRSPAGDERQVSAFGGGSVLDALGPNGEVTVISGRRYRTVPDYTAAPREVNSSLGTGLFENGNLFVIIGRSLFRANP